MKGVGSIEGSAFGTEVWKQIVQAEGIVLGWPASTREGTVTGMSHAGVQVTTGHDVPIAAAVLVGKAIL